MLQTRVFTKWNNGYAHLSWVSLLITLLCVIASEPVFALEYDTIFLGDLGGASARSTGINNLSQVVGVSKGLDGVEQPFIWSADTGMQKLQTSHEFLPLDINDNGVVAGYMSYHAAFWSNTTGLVGIGGNGGVAYAVNNNGYIAGRAFADVEPYFETAYVWFLDGTQTNLGFTPDSHSEAKDINNHNQVVGNGPYGAFIWDAESGIQYLGIPYRRGSWAYAINDDGVVVGLAGVDVATTEVFTWTKDSGMVAAFTFDLPDECYPTAINSSGTIVGDYNDEVFIWNPTDGLSIIGFGHASGINESGQISGWIDAYDGLYAVVWQPVPEPSSLLALAGGLGCLACVIRRRRL